MLTEEDAARGAYYAQERQRRALQTSSQSLEEFLHTLALEVQVTVDETEVVGRLAQLAARTNQFNLTTRRHPEAEIARMMGQPTHRVYALRAADRFGDNGIVMLLIVACEGGVWRIDTCLMSCRVIGRGIETALLSRVAADAAAAGVRELRGEYVRSAQVVGTNPAPAEGHAVWQRAIGAGAPLGVPPWIRMRDAG